MKRVAVIGVGTFGFFHAEKYAAMNGVDLLVVDNRLSRACEVADRLDCDYVDDYKKAAHVDYVSIVTPDELHFEMAKFFIENKCNVLVEKPMTQNLEDALILTILAEEYGVKLSIGYLERFNSVYQNVLVEKPEFNEISVYRSNSAHYCRSGADIILDLMIHDIDLVLGLVKSPVTKLEAASISRKNGINDAASAHVHFADGKEATFVAERISKHRMAQMELIGDDGITKLNFLEKDNDTLRDELHNFVNNGKPMFNQGFRAHRLALQILHKTREGNLDGETLDRPSQEPENRQVRKSQQKHRPNTDDQEEPRTIQGHSGGSHEFN